ncbi:MAG: hypothetical protein V1893_00060 [Candidatus Omnitrophota bacterium]
MENIFVFIGIISGFFGIVIVFTPKLYSSIVKNLSKTVATIDDISFRYKIPMGILLIIVSILMFYVSHLHKQIGVGL